MWIEIGELEVVVLELGEVLDDVPVDVLEGVDDGLGLLDGSVGLESLGSGSLGSGVGSGSFGSGSVGLGLPGPGGMGGSVGRGTTTPPPPWSFGFPQLKIHFQPRPGGHTTRGIG